MNRRILFVRIGYMKYYAGPQRGDEKPRHGGSYNTAAIGHEVYNFKPADGYVYGYFQPYSKKETDKTVTTNLGRIDPAFRSMDSIDNVLVVYVSRSEVDGQVIIGWCDNATVFREYQKPTKEMLRENYYFLTEAKATSAVLLPEKYRTYSIPNRAGAFGRASVVYPCEIDGTLRDFQSGVYSWIGAAVEFIARYDGPNLLVNSMENLEDRIEELMESEKAERSGQGFQITPDLRSKIETHAMAKAIKHFESLGYTVRNVGRTMSYDLECWKGTEVLRVEVKGT